MQRRNVKIIYVLLILALLVQHHYVVSREFPIPTPYVEDIGTLLAATIAYIVYRMYKRDREAEYALRMQAQERLQASSRELTDALTYIGKANRRIPLIEELTTQLYQKKISNSSELYKQLYYFLSLAIQSLAQVTHGLLVLTVDGAVVMRMPYSNGEELKKSVRNDVVSTVLDQLKEEERNAVDQSEYTIVHSCIHSIPVTASIAIIDSIEKENDEMMIIESVTNQIALLYHLYQDHKEA